MSEKAHWVTNSKSKVRMSNHCTEPHWTRNLPLLRCHKKAIKVSFITKHSTKCNQKETHFYLLLPSLPRFGRLGVHVFCFHVPVFLLPSLTNILQQQTNLTSPLKSIIVIRKRTSEMLASAVNWAIYSSLLSFATAEQFKENRVTHSVVMLWNSTLKL